MYCMAGGSRTWIRLDHRPPQSTVHLLLCEALLLSDQGLPTAGNQTQKSRDQMNCHACICHTCRGYIPVDTHATRLLLVRIPPGADPTQCRSHPVRMPPCADRRASATRWALRTPDRILVAYRWLQLQMML
mmetsp:Transcript_8074/g.18043  ORF Transcript_8074/g.18043 Transcript_8074/m.18043 type:complete len:131 (+) Transcript_8074:401-793(+)